MKRRQTKNVEINIVVEDIYKAYYSLPLYFRQISCSIYRYLFKKIDGDEVNLYDPNIGLEVSIKPKQEAENG